MRWSNGRRWEASTTGNGDEIHIIKSYENVEAIRVNLLYNFLVLFLKFQDNFKADVWLPTASSPHITATLAMSRAGLAQAGVCEAAPRRPAVRRSRQPAAAREERSLSCLRVVNTAAYVTVVKVHKKVIFSSAL